MKHSFFWKITTFLAFSIALLLSVVSFAQDTGQQAGKDTKTEVKGVAARTSPSDYQAHVQVGKITIAADFTEHEIAPPDANYTNENYVTAEIALFGPADAKLDLSYQNFSMKINGKKMPQPAEEFSAVFRGLKDPNYLSPEEIEYKKNKNGGGNGINTGGGGAGGGNGVDTSNQPPIVHIPIAMERAMDQKVRQAALPEGGRSLPVAGLVFFEHHGKVTSAELMYSGPAGKATLRLQ